MTKKVMELVDIKNNKMRCKVCSAEHFAMIKPQSGGKFYRGAWQCQNGCNIN